MHKLNYNSIGRMSLEQLSRRNTVGVYDVEAGASVVDVLVALDVGAEVFGGKVVCVFESVAEFSRVRADACAAGLSCEDGSGKGVVPGAYLYLVDKSTLFSQLLMRDQRLARATDLVFMTTGSDRVWSKIDAEMLAGDMRVERLLDLAFQAERKPAVSGSCDKALAESTSIRGEPGFTTVGESPAFNKSEREWRHAAHMSYGYCRHSCVVPVYEAGEVESSFSAWNLARDERAREALVCLGCDKPAEAVREVRQVSDLRSSASSDGADIHWATLFAHGVRQDMLNAYSSPTVGQLAGLLSQHGRWSCVKTAEYRRCAHGFVVVSPDVASEPTLGTLWSLAANSNMASAVVCGGCVSGGPLVDYGPDLVKGFSGMCYARAFPSGTHAQAVDLGVGPSASCVLELLKRAGLFEQLERPVRVVQGLSSAHVEVFSGGTCDVGEVAGVLSRLPSSLPVAGTCSSLSMIPVSGYLCEHCRARHVSQDKRVDDLGVACPCGCVEPRGWARSKVPREGDTSDHISLSMPDPANTVVAFSREPMDNASVCRAYAMAPNTVAQVRLHRVAGSPHLKSFKVEGSFVQVWIPVGCTVYIEGVIIRLERSPMVLTACGSVAAVLGDCDRDVIVARARDHSGKIRWLHSAAGIDPAESTFSRFWTMVAPSAVAFFSLGAGIGIPRNAHTYPDTEVYDGVGKTMIDGDKDVQTSYDGTVLCAVAGSVSVPGVEILRGFDAVFGPRIGSLSVKCPVGWELCLAEDAYAIDDGGPSDEDGFDSEF